MVLGLRYAAISDVGMVRQVNEDSGYAGPDLLVLADGMGGHAGGEVASAAAVASLQGMRPPGDGGDPTDTVRTGVAAAGESLRALVLERPELEGMGTTLTLLIRSRDVVAIAQVGDSRGYLLREGVLERVTRDQTFVQSLIDQGRISDEDAKNHPQRNLLLQALDGRAEVEPEVELRTARVGDRYLLCSDGLHGVVREQEMLGVAQKPLREAADEIEQLRKWWKRELNSCVEANKEIERLRGKLARLERDWDLRADAIRRTQKLHRAELKQARARWAGGAKTEGV
jgi:protein phosphatase